MPEPVRIERQGPRALITIDHPPANAISRQVIAGLREAIREAAGDQGIRVAVITGAGDRFFAAGADVKEFQNAGGSGVGEGAKLTEELEAQRLPTIAAVNGLALGGGCELAMACDLRIASSTARFGQPEINLGIIPGWGGTQRLPRLIGRGRALELLLLGQPIDPEAALEWGLVNDVVEPARLMDRAFAIADRLATAPPLAVAAIRRAVNGGLDCSLPEGMATELREFVAIFDTEDAKEGIGAFLEKRKPHFAGR